MEFDKNRVYTSLNADELRAGDKVIVSNNIGQLIDKVKQNYPVLEINGHANGYKERRFLVNDGFSYALAYLVERAENCTNCNTTCMSCIKPDKTFRCEDYSPKTEQKAYEYDVPIKGQINEDGVIVERQVGKCHVKVKPFTEEAKKACVCAMTNACPEKHYRPFKDTDELIRIWDVKYRYAYGLERINNGLDMPHIWVRRKGDPKDKGRLITAFNDVSVELGEAGGGDVLMMDVLFELFTFLDGSPCGVEE